MKKVVLIVLALCFTFIQAQDKEKEDKKENKSGKEKIEEKLKESELIDGILKVYRDSADGKVRILLSENDLNKEFIYFSQINNGISNYRLIRGNYMNSMVVKFVKKYDRIELIRENTNFYFDPNSALYNAKDANVNHPVLHSIKIEALDEENAKYLIDAESLFLNETFTQVKPETDPSDKFSFKLGSLNKEKSTIETIKNYQDNLNIKTDWVYSSGSAKYNSDPSILDPRNITVEIFHSIIAMPNNDYQARRDDPRIGYFMVRRDDQTSVETVNYRDIINRWNLVKKDPNAALSEPVEPITWWIENTTPERFRDLVKEGVLKWNKAFEKAGFKNAMVVKVQPDDADWDAGDIHYNVLRWTSSPNPRFGGYGPSFVNPKTGQILGADIMLEYVHHTNRVFYNKVHEQDDLMESVDPNYYVYCSAGEVMQKGVQLAKLLDQEEVPPQELSEMERQAMLELVMHEIGHTLGLNHNMKSSVIYTPEQLYDPNFTKNKCLTGSVMDYTASNINPDRAKQGLYYSTEVGPYDIWAIQYGYTPNLSENELNQIANRSTEKELIFGNDADDMRSNGKGMDPRVMIGDLSSNPIQFSKDRMDLMLNSYQDLESKLTKNGKFYDDFRRGVNLIHDTYWGANYVVSKWIGGVYINRAAKGQSPVQNTYFPVEYEKQKAAMEILSDYAFSNKAYELPPELFTNYARQRRGYSVSYQGEDIKIHSLISNAQNRILGQLVNKFTLERMINSFQYGNQYKAESMLNDLTQAIFHSKIESKYASFQQNLQNDYVRDHLIKLYHSVGLMPAAQNAVLAQLLSIQKKMKKPKGNAVQKAHMKNLYILIQNALKEK